MKKGCGRLKNSKKEVVSYTPSSLRVVASEDGGEEMWGIGIQHGRYEIGMTHGPFRTEVEALEIVGEVGACIVHFLPDGRDEVVWHWSKDRWVREK